MMDIIAVDPKLFITCRLCLDEMGQYQIVPSVKQQIKYCFDIEVEPFDGLPQLICVKCKDILSNYSTIKKTFNEKQTNLRNDVLLKNETKAVPQQDTVSSTQSQHDVQPPLDEQLQHEQPHEDNTKTETSIVKNKTNRLKAKLCSSNNSDTDSSHSDKKINKRQKTEKGPITWETDYKKLIICRLCNSSHATMRALKNHYHIHRPLINKYKYILNQYCSIALNKLDNKPNMTGLSNMVVHNNSKIIHSSDYYYTLYSKEVPNNQIALNNIVSSNLIDSDSTDEEHIFMKRKSRKRRFISRSSNDTVVLDTECNNLTFEEESKQGHSESELTKTNVDECINIDDTTDSEGENKNKSSRNLNPKKAMAAKLEDHKTIQDIIDSCASAYRLKKDYSKMDKPNKLDSHLKHIILSIGKKTISSKQSINCTGLLRYLEHKDLDILWIPRTHHNIFVTTKLKTSKNNDSGWFNIYTNPIQDSECVNIIDNPKSDCRWVSVGDNSKNNSGCINVVDNPKNDSGGVSNPIIDRFPSGAATDVSEYKIVSSNEPNQTEQGKIVTFDEMNKENGIAGTDSADDVMYTGSCTDTKNKLLNANPVANPKKLPKKVIQSSSTISENSLFINKDDKGLSMPIITSTTSLAEFPDSDDSCDVRISNNTTSEAPAQSAPRIKVKPVSELLSQQGLTNLIKEQAISATNNNLFPGGQVTFPNQNHMNILVPTLLPCLVSTSSQVKEAQEPFLNVSTPYQISFPNNTNTIVNNPNKSDHLILDTVELPNTKTNSPFAYLKSLVQIHNLILMNSSEKLPKSFVCLIQFKVVFTQESIEKPVVLCISLYCCKNMFCLKVKDVDIYKISANWQWEIIKVYTGDIVNKILQNAQKVSQITYENTNKFLCLLKSINLKK